MKPVKLNEVKVGDVIYDQLRNGVRLTVKVIAFTYVLVKPDAQDEHRYTLDGRGLIRFSIYSNENFYKQI